MKDRRITLSRDRFRCAAASIALGGSEFAVTQQTKDLVERGDFAFDPSDAFLGDNAAQCLSSRRLPRDQWLAQITVEMPASR